MKATILSRVGRLFFGASLVAFGLPHVLHGDFVTRVIPSWPPWLPPRPFWAAAIGAGLVTAGISTLTTIKIRPVLLGLAGVLLISLATLHLPSLVNDAVLGGAWTGFGKALVLWGGCLAVASGSIETATSPGSRSVVSPRASLAIGRSCLAVFLILAGAQHLRWTAFVATLVPAWVPGGATAWTYVSAVLLIGGGIGMLIPSTARPAALGSGAMIFLWVFMVHLPRVVHGVGSPSNESTALFEALGFSGLAFFYAARHHDDGD